MAGAIAGAMHGLQTIRPAWVEQVKRVNRCDFSEMGAKLAQLTHKLQQSQLEQSQQRARAFALLLKNA